MLLLLSPKKRPETIKPIARIEKHRNGIYFLHISPNARVDSRPKGAGVPRLFLSWSSGTIEHHAELISWEKKWAALNGNVAPAFRFEAG